MAAVPFDGRADDCETEPGACTFEALEDAIAVCGPDAYAFVLDSDRCHAIAAAFSDRLDAPRRRDRRS